MKEDQINQWLAEGKITAEQAVMMKEANNNAAKEKSSNKFISTISVIGSIFIGLGVIWVVGSNWEGMPDMMKIIILLLSTGGSLYLGYEIGYNKKTFQKTGHSLILLSALLFGASVFLIAQIFNVDSKASYLLFIWLLGILPLVYIFQSDLLTFLSCVVFCLWFNYMVINDFSEENLKYILFFYQSFGLFLFALGSLHYFMENYVKVARAFRLTGIYLTLLVLFCLTYLFAIDGLIGLNSRPIEAYFINPVLINSIIYLVIVVMIGINYKFNPSQSKSNPLENLIAFMILTVLFILNLQISQLNLASFNIVFWLLFNFAFIGLIIALFRIGYNRMDMKLINLASLSTFFFVLFKFFDIFSNLLSNGIAWIVFGIILLAGSLYLEKKRRQIRDQFIKEKMTSKNNG